MWARWVAGCLWARAGWLALMCVGQVSSGQHGVGQVCGGQHGVGQVNGGQHGVGQVGGGFCC